MGSLGFLLGKGRMGRETQGCPKQRAQDPAFKKGGRGHEQAWAGGEQDEPSGVSGLETLLSLTQPHLGPHWLDTWTVWTHHGKGTTTGESQQNTHSLF